MFAASEFPALPSSPPKAPRRVNFDDKTSYIARLQSQMTQEEADTNRFNTDAKLGLINTPPLPITQPEVNAYEWKGAAAMRAPTPAAKSGDTVPKKTPSQVALPESSKVLTTISPNKNIRKGKRSDRTPPKDPTFIKRTDLKKTPEKPENQDRNVQSSKKSSRGDTVTPASQADTYPYNPDTPSDSIDSIQPDICDSGMKHARCRKIEKEYRESFGDNGKNWSRDLANLRGESFDSAEWEEDQERELEQKELEARTLQDQWEKYKDLVCSGQITDLGFIEPWQYFNWKEEQELLENQYQQQQLEKADAKFLQECQIADTLHAYEQEIANSPEEEVAVQLEREQVSKQLVGRYEKMHQEETETAKLRKDDLYNKEYKQEVLMPYREEMTSQVACEFEDNISEPGEVEVVEKPDPFIYLRTQAKQPVKKQRAVAVDGNRRDGMAQKPDTPPPETTVRPAPKKQWIIRSGLTPEEEDKKKKATKIKDEWLKSQEKLINSLVDELAKQQKRFLKDALKERPEAINVLLGDDVPARRECVKIVLVEAIERKKTRDAKKAAAAERKAAKNAVANAAASQNDGAKSAAKTAARTTKTGRKKKGTTVKK